MRFTLFLLIFLCLTGCSSINTAPGGPTKPAASPVHRTQTNPAPQMTPTPENPPAPLPSGKFSKLPNLGAAPELTNEIWLNTDQPLRLKDLRGKVVLIDMWTFG